MIVQLAWAEPGKECRALFMRLRDSLNIFGSAYFPPGRRNAGDVFLLLPH